VRKPDYEANGVRLYCGDCLEIIGDLEGVDLVLTDPPYGIGLESHGQRFVQQRARMRKLVGDESQALGSMALGECELREWPTVAFADSKKPWPGSWRQHLVWYKGPAVGGGGDRETCWKFDWELVQVARTGDLHGQRDTAVLDYWITPADFPHHPCQKPTSLLNYLIGKATNEGDLVVDLFMGSGSVGVSCLQMRREFIGCEIDEQHFATAVRRIEAELNRHPLFEKPSGAGE
jgi:DNA modification methylase